MWFLTGKNDFVLAGLLAPADQSYGNRHLWPFNKLLHSAKAQESTASLDFCGFKVGSKSVKTEAVKGNADCMANVKDLRLHGVSFEEAVKRLLNAPPPPSSKKARGAKPKRKK